MKCKQFLIALLDYTITYIINIYCTSIISNNNITDNRNILTVNFFHHYCLKT